MLVSKLDIHELRNINHATLDLEQSSLIIGPNGSGKTSILEGLYVLSSGKSFRSSTMDSVINDDSSELVVRANVSGKSAGLQRSRNGKVSIRLDSKSLGKISELTRKMPIHVVEPNSVILVEGGPGERRKFLDFAMFHVEHDYLSIHKRFSAALKQRNALLKKYPVNEKEISYWDQVYCEAAWDLNSRRKALFRDVISPGISSSISLMLNELDISNEYEDGCKAAGSLEEFKRKLSENLAQDSKFKSTQIGPHRADIVLKTKGKLAKDYLSRGQKKLLTYGVRLAPAMMLKKENKNTGVILIDDMPSELDEHSIRKVCTLLNEIDAQTILTAVDGSNIQTEIIIQSMKPAMFHVEHGKVQRIES